MPSYPTAKGKASVHSRLDPEETRFNIPIGNLTSHINPPKLRKTSGKKHKILRAKKNYRVG
jgi:hypothetical protein